MSASNVALTGIKTYTPSKSINKDANGYYEFVLGAVNSLNSCGEFYLKDGIEKFINDENFILARKLKNGYLHGELGHPKFLPGMDKTAYYNRNINVDIQNVSHHIKSVWTEDTNIDSGIRGRGNVVLLKGLVKPSGVHGKLLQEHIDNNDSNTAFSIRALTMNKNIAGVTYKTIVQIITWDWVLEPGIRQANKWHNLSTESIDYATFSIEELTVNTNEVYKELAVACEATEEAKDLLHEAVCNLKRNNAQDILYRW